MIEVRQRIPPSPLGTKAIAYSNGPAQSEKPWEVLTQARWSPESALTSTVQPEISPAPPSWQSTRPLTSVAERPADTSGRSMIREPPRSSTRG